MRPWKRWPAADKADAIARVLAGEKVAAVAESIGTSPAHLGVWLHRAGYACRVVSTWVKIKEDTL